MNSARHEHYDESRVDRVCAPEPHPAPDAAQGATGDVRTPSVRLAGGETPDPVEPKPRVMLPRARIEAFVNSPSSLAAVEGAARDRRAVRSEISIYPGGFTEALERYREHPPADLIVIEDAGSAENIAWQIESLAEFCPPTTRLVVIGACNDIVLYRRLIKLGVSDYMVQPITPLVLLDSIAASLTDDEEAKDLGLVVAFVGTRGGVGSSTVAHNAAAISRQRFDATTLLIDADIGFGTAALQFDLTTPHGLGEALKEREDLDSEVLEKLIHWRDKRFGILTAPDRLDQIVIPEPDVMRCVIDQARRLAEYVVLDLPHGMAPYAVEAIAAADRVVLVATPDLPSLRNARTLFGLMQKLRPNDEPAQLVLNRMPVKRKPQVAKEDFARVLDRKVALTLPLDETVVNCEMAGRVLADETPGCEIAGSIEALLSEISGRKPPGSGKSESKSLFSRLFSGKR